MSSSSTEPATFNINAVRSQFPILETVIHGNTLAYFDNAATTQKPESVINCISDYYKQYNANIHRAVHTLGERATKEYEESRSAIKNFINAESNEEIIFVRGVTEAINLVANGFRKSILEAEDEILITAMEHHSNIVPWQLACEEVGAKLKVVPINQNGELIYDQFLNLLTDKVKLVSIVHISNALGTVNPVSEMIKAAHAKGIPVLIDGAQAIPHCPVDVQKLDADFYAFSGHKAYGPTGIGVLYGKKAWLDKLAPYQGGGDMIRTVTFEKTTYAPLPYKFEAGTPDISGVIGLKKALEFIEQIGYPQIIKHENALLSYAENLMRDISGVKIIGTAAEKAGAISFVIDGIHPHDLGTFLDHSGIAIRTGHHCAQPVMDFFDVPATARASFAVYNTFEEVDRLIEALKNTIKVFA